MDKPQLSDSDFTEWLQHPVTRVFRSLMLMRREGLKEQWASGAFTDQGHFATAILNARAIGGVNTLQELLDLDAAAMNGEINDDSGNQPNDQV